MISLDDLRRRAADALPHALFQPYGDSPTIRSYTDWSVFEKLFGLPPAEPEVSGATTSNSIPSVSFDPAAHRMLAFHFSRLQAFHVVGGSELYVRSIPDYFSHAHALLCVRDDRELFLDFSAADGPASLTLDVLVRPGAHVDLNILVRGVHPQFLHARYNLGGDTSISIRSAVLGQNAHVHHEFFQNGEGSRVDYSGASIGGRSDVVTDAAVYGVGSFNRTAHAVFSAPGDFVVHRGVLRVLRSATGADVDMDSAFLTTGGLAASVPMLEVLTGNVRRASHRSRDLSMGDEQIFYLQSRGLSPSEAVELYVAEIVKERLGDRLFSSDSVVRAVRSFSESLSH